MVSECYSHPSLIIGIPLQIVKVWGSCYEGRSSTYITNSMALQYGYSSCTRLTSNGDDCMHCVPVTQVYFYTGKVPARSIGAFRMTGLLTSVKATQIHEIHIYRWIARIPLYSLCIYSLDWSYIIFCMQSFNSLILSQLIISLLLDGYYSHNCIKLLISNI